MRPERGMALLAICWCACGGCTCQQQGDQGRKGRTPVVVLDPEEEPRGTPLDEVEPNDSPRQAQLLPHGAQVAGTQATKDAARGDIDTYLVQVPESGRILQAILGGVSELDLVLEAWSTKRQRLVRVNNSKEGEGEVLVNLAVEQGPLLLVVREARRRTAPGRYRLRYSLRPREEGEELEPNWKAELATPFVLGGEMNGYLGWHTDTDWYRVELKDLAPESRLRVEFDGLDEVKASLSLRDRAGAILQERWGGVGEAIALPNLSPRPGETELFVVLRCQYTFNVESRYSLRVIAAVPPVLTEAEPNDSVSSATALVLETPIAATIGDVRDRDIFSLRVTQPQLVSLLVVPPLDLDLALALVDEGGVTLWEINDGGPRERELMPSVWVKPPRALFQIWVPGNQKVTSGTSYHLKAAALVHPAWEREPNSAIATPTPWPAEWPQISGHLHPRGDVDYYRVASGGEKLHLCLTPGGGRTAVKLELLDLAGTPVTTGGAPDATGALCLEAAVTLGSEHILRVSGTDGQFSPSEVYQLRRVNP